LATPHCRLDNTVRVREGAFEGIHHRGARLGLMGPTRRRSSLESVTRLKRARLPPRAAHSRRPFLYLVAFAYSIFYNYNVIRSAMLAISTGMLQQLAVLGVIFLFLRWRGNEVNRGR